MTLRYVFKSNKEVLDVEDVFNRIKFIYNSQMNCIREIIILAVNLGLLSSDVISRPQLHIRLVKSLYAKYRKSFDGDDRSKLMRLENEAIRTLGYSLSYISSYYHLNWSKYESYSQFVVDHPGMLELVKNQDRVELWFEGSMHDPFMERMLFMYAYNS